MIRYLRLATPTMVLCLWGCNALDKSDQPIEQQASERFGLQITRVTSEARQPRFERCHGQPALVVPPRGSVEVPVRRGFHTLSGEFAICDLVGAAPVEFRVELLATATRVLLGQPAAVPELQPRDSYPFLVTFWAEEDAPLLLQSVGESPSVKTAWLGLHLDSVPYPVTRPEAVAAKKPKPQDDGLPDSVARPGMRRPAATLEVTPSGGYWLTDWGWNASASSWGPIEIDQSNGAEYSGDGSPLTINGRVFGKGVGMHPPGRIVVDLYRRCRGFTAEVGVDDAVGDAGSVQFFVFADNEPLFKSKVLTGKDDPERVDVPLNGRGSLVLLVENSDDGPENDWANWAEAQLFCDPP